MLILFIGVIAGVLLTWSFKPSITVEKLVKETVTVEVMPPLNCEVVPILDGLKKGESLTRLIHPYSELKAAYISCLNSIKEARNNP